MTWDASSSPLFSGNDMESRMILSMASPPLDTISLSPLPMEEQQHNYHPLNHLDRRLRLEQDILPLEKFARGASYPDTKELHDTYHRPLARVFEKDTASIGIFHDSVYSDEFSYPSPSSHGGPALDISSISETDRSPSPKAGPFRYSGSYSMDAGSSFVSHCWVSGNWFGMPCDVQNVDEVMYPEPATPVQQKVSQIYSPRASLYNSQGEILNDLEINDDVDADGEPDAMCADRDESKPSSTIQSTSKMLPPKTKKNPCDRGRGRKSAVVTATNPILKPPIFKRVTSRKCSQSSRSNKARGSAKETSSSAAATAAAADRMYTCSFKMYGCESTFSSKNEWKRHVVSQHLKLEFYRCDLKGCDDTHKGPNDFNRKDLFIQHLRRMHAPWPGKTVPSSAEKEKFENTLDAHAVRCVQKLRDPPARTNCVVCKEVFVAWSDRMEHMSKHYERLSQFKEARDPDLEAWACREDILSPKDSSSDELILTDLISKRRSG